ncbi:MAG: M23 family metallopeptidase [candidate division KSB1 bacterium]|nr:M23 family metallopeptidase [candidate division KSB1 bacterium]MDZ7317853.1 M23 family metallopeptidase [candidate division KSB1 bacterium]MDZ7340347.1 M23 family metallopeptidase [candidate division KSB1 bacterium]
MSDKRIKLIFFSLRGSEVKNYDIGWKKVMVLSTMLLVILLVVIGALTILLTNFFQSSTLTSLQRTNQLLKTQLGEISKKLDNFSAQMDKFEEYDNDQRLIAGLDEIDKDSRYGGRGGPETIPVNDELNILSGETREQISDLNIRLDQLEERIRFAQESQQAINAKFEENDGLWNYIPTIIPVERGKITDKFGMRIDPFTERPKLHTGIDIAAPTGTPVYAAAYGVVTAVTFTYSPNRDYGQHVIVDHGYNKETLYAHLSQINVKVGQKVKRWDVIGLVGETGRATGPHLHYEVRENGAPVNPVKYFFE